jgi:hypothetical protein
MANNNNIMVDIETLATSIDAHVVTIGAVVFSICNGEIVDEFYVRISAKSCEELNLKKDQATLDFWKKQSEEAQKEAFDLDNRIPLLEALQKFTFFWKKNKGKYFWCQGANFDEPILSFLYEKVGLEKPWKFYNVRCLRTYLSVLRLTLKDYIHTPAHNALLDCKNQVIAFNYASKEMRKWDGGNF